MRCTSCGFDFCPNFAARTKTRIDNARCLECRDRRPIQRKPFTLSDHLIRPSDRHCGEILMLSLCPVRGRCHEIQILISEKEHTISGSCRNRCDQRRSQIAKVKISGRRRCEPANHCTILITWQHDEEPMRKTEVDSSIEESACRSSSSAMVLPVCGAVERSTIVMFHRQLSTSYPASRGVQAGLRTRLQPANAAITNADIEPSANSSSNAKVSHELPTSHE